MNYPVRNHSSFSGLIGVSQKDITPPVGIYSRNWGAAKQDIAKGIHRPLMLTCVTFQSSKKEKPLVLISADLGWWKSLSDERFLRDEILKVLSLDPSRLLFCLSHTHAGPSICLEDVSKPGGQLIEPYIRHIQKTSIDVIQQAISKAIPAMLTWHYGKCGLATNRDLMEPEKKRLVVGFNPEQEADDTVLVGRITDDHNKTCATIVNYACHPTTLAWDNALISPDYIGSMREVVESQTQAPCLFLQGASGELAPAEQYVGDVTLADKYGRQLGYVVLATLEAMLPPGTQLSFNSIVESGAPLAIWAPSAQKTPTTMSVEMIEIEFPLRSLPSLADIEKKWQECTDRVLKERLWRQRGIRKTIGEGKIAKIPLWVWQLGDSFLIGQPNEAYSAFQQALRQKLTPCAVAVMNIANGHIGYLPPSHLYNQNVYAVWQTPFEAGSLELLINTASTVAHKMNAKP